MNFRAWYANCESPILCLLERLFALFAWFSLAERLCGPRRSRAPGLTDEQWKSLTLRRSRQIDLYVLLWLALECALVPITWHYGARPSVYWPIRAAVAYRVFDIMQTQLNINLFAPLRVGTRAPQVASMERMVVMSLLNFGELILCFGVAYSTAPYDLVNAQGWFAPYYFSIITQLTVGYGDLTPVFMLRALVGAQTLCGFLLGVLVIGRLAAFLPRAEAVVREPEQEDKPV